MFDNFVTKSTFATKKEKRDATKAPAKDNQNNKKSTFDITDYENDRLNTSRYLSENALSSDVFERDEFYRRGSVENRNGKNIIIPSRHIEEKPESYATIRLMKRSKFSKDVDFGTFEREQNLIPPYTRFFLQQTSFVEQEKMQIIETFGDFKIFFSGKKPVIKQYSGILLNTKNHDWLTDFEFVYQNYLRGTQAVRRRAITYLTFDNVIVEGYLFMANFNRSAISNNQVPFSFNMIVTDKIAINLPEVKFRNRLYGSKITLEDIRANEDKLPPTAIRIMRDFFDNQSMAGEKTEQQASST